MLASLVDAVLDADPGPPPAYDLDTLNRLLDHPKLLPDGVEAKRNGSPEVSKGQRLTQDCSHPSVRPEVSKGQRAPAIAPSPTALQGIGRCPQPAIGTQAFGV